MRTSVRSLTLISVMTALLSILAPFVLPIGPVPISLATLLLSLYVLIFPPKKVLGATALYLALGAVGLPVFSGFSGGLTRLAGPTGGYLFGYLLFVLTSGMLLSLINRKVLSHTAKQIFLAGALLAGTLFLYVLGTLWFCVQMNSSPIAALSLCVLPFIPGDIVKIFLALLLAPPIKKALKRIL